MDDLVRVVGYRSERQAAATAKDLVARGIGASVRDDRLGDGGPHPVGGSSGGTGDFVASSDPDPAVAPLAGRPAPPEPVVDPFGVYVVSDDRARALELLGLLDERDVQVAHTQKVRSDAPPLKFLIPIILAAFILLPLAAFLLTFKLSGG